MPWNAALRQVDSHQEFPGRTSGPAIHGGIEQVGCVYTAQGFEFDYVGVIFGPDLVYRPGIGWVGQPEESKDRIVRSGGVARRLHRFRQEHLPRALDSWPPRLLCLFPRSPDAGLRAQPP